MIQSFRGRSSGLWSIRLWQYAGKKIWIKYAVTSEVVADVMFAPIEASVAKRRIELYKKKMN